MDELIARINQLVKKQKEIGLTDQEVKEQHELRQAYLKMIRNQVKQQLSTVTFVDKSNHKQ